MGCQPPPIEDLIGEGINCKATLELPDRHGETIEVEVRIYDCKEA